MADNNNKTSKKRLPSFFYSIGRIFLGSKLSGGDHVGDERYDSPSKQAVKRFFRKPLAVIAVTILVCMFLLVFIGPLFSPIDLSYTEILHANVGPNLDMMDIPRAMKDNPKSITSRGSFTLGLDADGNVHTWGYFKTFSSDPRRNVMNIPDEVKDATILFAAAGTDHCIAIGDDGTIYGWGEDGNCQYGNKPGPGGIIQPVQKVDVSNVKKLICGNQMTAILMNDGTFICWGNLNSGGMNVESMQKLQKDGARFDDIVFTNSDLFAIDKDGKFVYGKNNQYLIYELGNSRVNTMEYIGTRKVVSIVSSVDTMILLLEDGEMLTLGTERTIPQLNDGEKIVSIAAGSRHFTILTDTGRVIAWGNGALGQTEVPKKLTEEGAVDTLYSTGFQNYAFKDGELVKSWGLKGYALGTDNLGRDMLNRIINGGKMTMTIGAVAVIVSSIIGIIIGCLSGYFGGWVDMLLMRVAEIFSAIPFLPFALVLSAVLQGSSIKEDTRIFIIMIILGLLSWTGLAKLIRGQILAEREKEFVLAAKAMGVKETKIAFKHILPNIISVIIVSLTLDFATCMLTESSLSYLGFGVRLPRPTWGNILDGCRNAIVIQHYWWRWLFPSIFLALTVICINVIGDTLRDVLDPKSEVEK